jgi:hypothetical protein
MLTSADAAEVNHNNAPQIASARRLEDCVRIPKSLRYLNLVVMYELVRSLFLRRLCRTEKRPVIRDVITGQEGG